MSIETRIQKIKDYTNAVAVCRKAWQELKQTERKITVKVKEDNVDQTFACIKMYDTKLPLICASEAGEGDYSQVKYCHRFDDNPCPIFTCPFHEQKKQNQIAQLLLKQAQDAKRDAFKGIFQRTK